MNYCFRPVCFAELGVDLLDPLGFEAGLEGIWRDFAKAELFWLSWLARLSRACFGTLVFVFFMFSPLDEHLTNHAPLRESRRANGETTCVKDTGVVLEMHIGVTPRLGTKVRPRVSPVPDPKDYLGTDAVPNPSTIGSSRSRDQQLSRWG